MPCSPWVDSVFDVLQDLVGVLPKTWPDELPPEGSPDLWEKAVRLEFKYRDDLTERLRHVLSGNIGDAASFSPILSWLCTRRIEYTTRILTELILRGVRALDMSPLEYLRMNMADSWHEEGALVFWDHVYGEEDGTSS